MINILTLKEVLNQHMPADTAINILSIDCEGSDLDILKTNYWAIYKPSVICVEDDDFCLNAKYKKRSHIQEFLEERSYRQFVKSGPSCMYEKITQ